MSNFEALPEEEQNFILDEIRSRTMLPDEALRALLEAGWSYTEDGNGHRWTINALEGQTVSVAATQILIPEILLPPHGLPVNSNAIQQVHDAIKLPKDREGSVEHAILMATLRAVYQGYKQREDEAKAERDAELVKELEENPNG